MFRLLPIACFAAAAQAAPVEIPWQGRVFEARGFPYVGAGDVTVTLRPDATTTSTPLWSDTFQVTVTDGYLNLVLGSGAPLDLAAFPSDPPYLHVQFGSLLVIGPARLHAVPYAVRAQALVLTDDATCNAANAGRMGTIPGGGVRFCSGADGWLLLAP